MPLMIRFRQQGRKNRQSFRLVLTDSRSPRDGKFIEKLGWYLPCEKKDNLFVDEARVNHWLGMGAQFSESAEKFVGRAAPEVMKELRLKREQKRVKVCAKNRALRKKSGAKEKEAASSK